MVKYMVSKIDRFIFFELYVQKGIYEGQKIKKDKITLRSRKTINLIAVQGEKDISKLLSSIDRVFIELFNLKESELPWLNTNNDKEWDDFMRKSRLAFYRIYFELIQKERVLH